MADVILGVIALLVIGFLLIAIEMFVIPGFGVFGIIGIASLIGGTLIAFNGLGTLWGVLTLTGSFLLSVLGVFIFVKTNAGRRFVLTSTSGVESEEQLQEARSKSPIQGAEGVAITTLRPSGTVEVQGHRYDAMADGDFIPLGTRIRVVRSQGFQVLVEPIEEDVGESDQ